MSFPQDKPLPRATPDPKAVKPATKGGEVVTRSDAQHVMESIRGLKSAPPNVARSLTKAAQAETFKHARSKRSGK